MSRAWVWIATGLSAAFLAGTAVLLGARFAAGPQGSPESDAARTAQPWRVATRQGEQKEVDRLRRLVATYRQREAVYRQRLEEANRFLRSVDRQQGLRDRDGLRYRSREREEREEYVKRRKRGDREAREREEHERDRNGLRYRSGEREEREEYVKRRKRGDREAHEREEHEREEYQGREHEDED